MYKLTLKSISDDPDTIVAQASRTCQGLNNTMLRLSITRAAPHLGSEQQQIPGHESKGRKTSGQGVFVLGMVIAEQARAICTCTGDQKLRSMGFLGVCKPGFLV